MCAGGICAAFRFWRLTSASVRYSRIRRSRFRRRESSKLAAKAILAAKKIEQASRGNRIFVTESATACDLNWREWSNLRLWPSVRSRGIPTMEEEGVPGLYASFWHGLWAPKATPAAIVTRLNSAVRAALADPAVQKRYADQGQTIPPPERQSPEALGKLQKAEIEKWWPIIKNAGIKAG